MLRRSCICLYQENNLDSYKYSWSKKLFWYSSCHSNMRKVIESEKELFQESVTSFVIDSTISRKVSADMLICAITQISRISRCFLVHNFAYILDNHQLGFAGETSKTVLEHNIYWFYWKNFPNINAFYFLVQHQILYQFADGRKLVPWILWWFLHKT